MIVPYAMPGYDLAKVVSRMWPQHGRPDTRGMVPMNHGLFTSRTPPGKRTPATST